MHKQMAAPAGIPLIPLTCICASKAWSKVYDFYPKNKQLHSNNNNKLLMPCVYNTRYHSIGLKVKEKQESNPGRQSDDRMGENSRGEG